VALPTPASGSDFIQIEPGEAPEAYDRRWRAEVYQGEVPQLTLRSVLTGLGLGSVLAISNLYVGLKAGWTLGVAITACVASTALWRGLHRAGLSRSPMGILEQNCMQSTASAAGFTTASLLVTAVPAYMLMTGTHVGAGWLILWTFLVSALGLVLALPAKRLLLHYERMAWPSAVAAAQTLRSLHETGRRAAQQGKALLTSMCGAALVQWGIGNNFGWWPLPRLPESWMLPGRLAGHPLSAFGVGLDGSTLYAAAGAIVGLRISSWILAGSTLGFLVLAPWLMGRGQLETPSYPAILLAYGLWLGASMLVSASLTMLALQWRIALRGLLGLRALVRRVSRGREDALAGIEPPFSWFAVGTVLMTAGVIAVAERVFGIDWWLSLIAVLMSAAAVIVAIRATGETDITPIGSLGKVSQLGLGAMAPGRLGVNLFGTSIVATSAAAASDLMVNLKCGHFLGAHPRRQFVAQLLGILVGTVVVVATFSVLVPSADRLGTTALPAPAAQSWRVVAEIVAGGLGSLDPLARLSLAAGSALGVLLAVLESARPRWRPLLPSAIGLGTGLVIPFSISASFFVGALLVALVEWRRPRLANDFAIPVSSGLIAGDSLMGVLLALLIAAGLMNP
jgi:putative OPT family oligopeptide transporter